MNVMINIFHQDYILNQHNFNQKKYYKFFSNLIYLIENDSYNDKDNTLNNTNQKTYYFNSICDTLKILSPMNYPGFILAWLDLISNNYFIKYFLDINLIKENSIKYEKYLSLLIEILLFISLLKNKNISYYYLKVIIDNIYKFFFLLSNTYSAFIASYNYILLSYLPSSASPDDEDNNSFLQLKNIFLSAVPPDFSEKGNNKNENNKNYYKENFLSLKLFKDNLISNKIINILFDNNENSNNEDLELNKLLDKYINEKNDENILESILNILDGIKNERELYSIYNGIMLYWCQKKLKQIAENKNKSKKIFYNFYFYLLCNLNEVHKKYLIDSILNALRFPCAQTTNYCILFIELFTNLENEDLEKQLMVNILERMLYKPIPWGIKYTLNSLFGNEKYQQLEKKYITQNSEIMQFIAKISINLVKDVNELKNSI